jgi:hypothetical protein
VLATAHFFLLDLILGLSLSPSHLELYPRPVSAHEGDVEGALVDALVTFLVADVSEHTVQGPLF